MKSENSKRKYFQKYSDLFKVLSSPVRLQLINYISFCPRTVEDCAKKTKQSVQNVSLHLAALNKSGILEVEKIKNFRFYSVAKNQTAFEIMSILRSPKETLLPQELVCDLSLVEIEKKVRKGEVKLIDLRSLEENSYIPLSTEFKFPDKLEEIPVFLKKFKKNESLIFVCKGRMCERLAEAVMLADKLNYHAQGLTIDSHELSVLGSLLAS